MPTHTVQERIKEAIRSDPAIPGVAPGAQVDKLKRGLGRPKGSHDKTPRIQGSEKGRRDQELLVRRLEKFALDMLEVARDGEVRETILKALKGKDKKEAQWFAKEIMSLSKEAFRLRAAQARIDKELAIATSVSQHGGGTTNVFIIKGLYDEKKPAVTIEVQNNAEMAPRFNPLGLEGYGTETEGGDGDPGPEAEE